MKKKLPYFFVIISIFILLLTVTVKDLNVTFAATVDNLTLKENAKVAYDTTSITSDVSSFNRYSIRYKSSTYIKGVITYKVNGVIENERFFLEPTEDYKVFSSFINGYIDNYSSTKKDIVSLEFENISTEGTFSIDYFELLSYPEVDALIASINGSLSETKYQSDKTIFLANDNIKVGFSLKYGGSINYISGGNNIFSDFLANKNIVNSYDNGRLIQQCIYGNALFSDGKAYLTGESDNIGGRYNPIQGGEENHPSKIVDIGLSTDKKEITIVTKPSLWRVNNQNYLNKYYDSYYQGYTADAYMKNTYKLHDTYIYADTTYVDFTDNVNETDGSTRSESPSVYPVSALNKFYAYDIQTKTTKEYQIGPTVDGNGFPQLNDNHAIYSSWGGYFATNNDITEGIGLYHPSYDSSYQYIKGFVAADKLTTESKDASTSFFTNIMHLDSRYGDGALHQFKNFKYDYLLTLGNINNIRNIMDTYRNDYSYKLTVNPNGGTFDNSSEVTTLSPDLLAYWGNWNNIGAATRNGYKFLGYYSKKTGGELVYDTTGLAVKSSYWKISDRTETKYQYIGAKDLTVYARWEPITYTITYNLNGGTVSSNPTSYNIETNTFTINNPTKKGYIFTGWLGTNISESTKNLIIEKGSTGNREYIATWTEEVKDLEVTVNDYIYNSDKDIIKNIPISTTKEELLSKLTVTTGYTIKTDITDKVFTGSKIKIYYEDKLYKEIINIVLGDTNGDGELSVFDIVKVNNHIIDETKELAEIYELAADYNKDGTISVFDIVKMNNKIIAES